MLVLSGKVKQSFFEIEHKGETMRLYLVARDGNKIEVGFDADRSWNVRRKKEQVKS